MIIVGFILLAAAVAVAIALIAQNGATVTVHAFSGSWNVDMRWLVVAGLALTAIALIGLVMMRFGGAYLRRLRQERKALAVENKRLAAQRTRDGVDTGGGTYRADRAPAATAGNAYRPDRGPGAYRDPAGTVPVGQSASTEPVAESGREPAHSGGRRLFHRHA